MQLEKSTLFLSLGNNILVFESFVSCSFRDGIRSAHFSDTLRGGPTKRNKRRFRFGLEALSSSLVQMRRGDTLDLGSDVGLVDLDEDLLNIQAKGLANLKIFFLDYVKG